MKQYIFGILAIALAVTTAAFTTPEKKVDNLNKLFYYVAPSGSYAQTDVQNRANWHLTLATTGCSLDAEKACEIRVSDTYINPDNTLKSNINIVADQFATNVYFVKSGNMDNIYNTEQ
ncbi:MAG: hypothetical protein ABIP30_16745 [Ferruginibacter sp.]